MIKNIQKKNTHHELDEETASQMLENIFNACEVEPNSVPLSVLTSYSNYRQARYRLQKILLIIIIILFCLMPLLFLTPKLDMKQSVQNNKKGKKTYIVDVDSFIPISHITANIDGQNISVYETSGSQYTIEPTRNGKMTIVVTLKNRQYSTLTYDVSGIDTAVPVLVSNESKDGQIFLHLSDDESGVDYESIYALDLNGNTIEPAVYNEKENYVAFSYPSGSMNVYIPDKAGNTLQLVLTVRNK